MSSISDSRTAIVKLFKVQEWLLLELCALHSKRGMAHSSFIQKLH